ncbi:MAG: glucuronate isomerase [Blautia sp.]
MLLNNDFLLKGDWSKKLFHNYAEKMPIIDYHCHLIPKEIYENKQYDNLTQVWLYDNGFGDHYKWRLLRANGTEETYITGDGEAYEKYLEFVKAVGKAVEIHLW